MSKRKVLQATSFTLSKNKSLVYTPLKNKED